MKKVYIHSSHSFIARSLDNKFEKYEFTTLAEAIDHCKEADVVFIEISLTQGNYEGFELAAHLRLDADKALN